MDKAVSMEDALARSNALTQLQKNEQYQEVSKYVNPEALDLTTQILSTVGGARLLETNKELAGQMINTFGDLLSSVSGSPRVNYTATVQGKNIVSQGLVSLAKDGLTNPKALTGFETVLNTIAKDVADPKIFQTPSAKFGFYEKLIKDLGDPTVKQALSKVGVTSISQATGMIDDYMGLTIPDMWKQIRSWESKGVSVTMDVLPDGRAIFKTDNPQATQDMNTRYSPRINDSLAAMSNLMGLDTKSTAVNQFYPNYLSQFADDPDLQPLELKSKAAVDKALASGRITKAQHTAILRSGF